MKTDILANLNNADELEQLYRADKRRFEQSFTELYPGISDSPAAAFWRARLKKHKPAQRTLIAIPFMLCICAVTAFLSRLPATKLVSNDFYYPRNLAFITLPMLAALFLYRERTSKLVTFLCLTFPACVLFINSLPDSEKSQTLILSCICMPVCAWFLAGCAFTGKEPFNHERRTGYLKFNADLLIMTTLLLLAGMIMTGITIALFHFSGYSIESFYMKNIAAPGVAMSPLIATYLINRNHKLVSRISPLLARFFSPLALLTLLIYLPASVVSGKDPYNDRDFLIVFNVTLISVLAIIFFCVTGGDDFAGRKPGRIILLLLAVVTIVINVTALSAILYRLAEMGSTPNRIAVLGSNILMLLNLLLITYRLVRSLKDNTQAAFIPRSISQFLPVYFAWAIILTFAFPFIFGFG